MLRNHFEASINKLKTTSISGLKSQMKKHIDKKDKKIHSLINKLSPNDKCLKNNIRRLCSDSKYKDKVFNIVKSLIMQGAGSKMKSRSRSPSRSRTSRSKTSRSRSPSRSRTSRSRTSRSKKNASKGRGKRGGYIKILFIVFVTIYATYTLTSNVYENRMVRQNNMCRRYVSMRDVEIYEDIFKYPSSATIQSCKKVLEDNNHRVTRRNRPTKSNNWW